MKEQLKRARSLARSGIPLKSGWGGAWTGLGHRVELWSRIISPNKPPGSDNPVRTPLLLYPNGEPRSRVNLNSTRNVGQAGRYHKIGEMVMSIVHIECIADLFHHNRYVLQVRTCSLCQSSSGCNVPQLVYSVVTWYTGDVYIQYWKVP